MISITPDTERPGGFRLRTETTIRRPVSEVFAFFSDALNLQTLTPPFLHFKVLTPAPIEMRAGTLIDYKLWLRVVPIRWRTEITVWEPNVRFMDRMLRGPYRYWEHTHEFRETPEGTHMLDDVRYGVPGGALVHKLVVRRDVENIFRYRQEQLERIFAG
jgi:ligand-binding SRPBCC domain-containing protein